MRDLGEGLEVGGALSAAQTYSDNFYYQTRDPKSVQGLLLSPALEVKQKYGRATTSLNAGAQIAEFDAPTDFDDYADSQIAAALRYDGGVRSSFRLGAGSRRGHDPVGVDRTAGNPLLSNREIDKFTLNSVDAGYRYGAPSARYNVEFGADYRDKDYTTDELATRALDYEKVALSQALFVNYSPKTAFLLELSEDFVEYKDQLAAGALDRDATELRARTGIRWEATAKTRGDLRVGAVRRRLDDSRVEAVSGFSWQGKVTWEPSSRTSVVVETSRSSQESFSNAFSVLDNRRYSLTLSQGWGRNFRTTFAAGVGESVFVGSPREDDLENYTASAVYSFKNSMAVYADIGRFERDSNLDGFDFQATGFVVGLRVSP